MNLVVIQAVLQSGLEYLLSYRFWTQTKDDSGLTKYDLAKQLLLQLRESVSCRLWVAMDSWYCKREFMVFLQDKGFDWVTKAKRNTALYRKITVAGHKASYIPVSGRQLIKENFHLLIANRTTGLTAISLPDIYMKLPF